MSCQNNLSLIILRLIISFWTQDPTGDIRVEIKKDCKATLVILGIRLDASIGDEIYINLAKTSCSWICCECKLFTFLIWKLENNYFHPFTAFNSRSFEKFVGLPKRDSSPKTRPPLPSSFHQMPEKKEAKLKNASLRCLLRKSKRAELEHVIEKYNPDLLLGTGTWLTPRHRQCSLQSRRYFGAER